MGLLETFQDAFSALSDLEERRTEMGEEVLGAIRAERFADGEQLMAHQSGMEGELTSAEQRLDAAAAGIAEALGEELTYELVTRLDRQLRAAEELVAEPPPMAERTAPVGAVPVGTITGEGVFRLVAALRSEGALDGDLEARLASGEPVGVVPV